MKKERGYFILIRGPLGIGKSTISQKLCKRLRATYFSMDLILDELHLESYPSAECIPAKNFIKANEHILSLANALLEKGKIVVFDGCFYHKEQIVHLFNHLKGKGIVFDLKALLEVCIVRDRGRKKVYGEDAARAVYSLVSRFDYGPPIDTTGKTALQIVRKILTFLPP